MCSRIRHKLALAAAAAVLAAAAASQAYAEPPDFGVEAEAGKAVGLSSYVRNEVVTDAGGPSIVGDQRVLRPSLADLKTGGGTGFGLRLVASNIAAGLTMRWFDLDTRRVHHRGQASISPSRRRPDGSVDDAGVGYDALTPPLDVPIADNDQSSLLIFGLTGVYRFTWPGETVDFFVPVGGQLVVTHVSRPAAPYRIGLDVTTGAGLTIHISETVGVVFSGRVHGLVTPHYGRRDDAARRAVATGESTESAYFSTLAYASGNLALQFTIR